MVRKNARLQAIVLQLHDAMERYIKLGQEVVYPVPVRMVLGLMELVLSRS
ncbi:MAG: hypothetical protein ACTSYJ_09105 [Candidatus Thorarchaeota archaeon]